MSQWIRQGPSFEERDKPDELLDPETIKELEELKGSPPLPQKRLSGEDLDTLQMAADLLLKQAMLCADNVEGYDDSRALNLIDRIDKITGNIRR